MFDWQLCVHVLGLCSRFAVSTDEAVNVHNDIGAFDQKAIPKSIKDNQLSPGPAHGKTLFPKKT